MRSLIKFTWLFLFSTSVLAQTLPTVSIIPVSSSFCTGLPITFSSSVNQTPVNYSWSLSSTKGLLSNSDLNSNTLSLTFTANLAYTITLSVSDANGTATTTTAIQINKQPKSSFYAVLDAAGFPAKLVLTNYSTNQVSNYWQFSDNGSFDFSSNTVKQYNVPGNYTVSLVAKGLKGCDDVSSYSFEIPKTSYLILPNVFTPNNDGINDIYRPLLAGINTIKAVVFNRYGEIITTWDKVNGFWDGYTNSGQAVSDGQYFISVEATGFDGQNYKLRNRITLAR
jgi:gliding motility-associated-like protein